jgi:hypothetical protein
MLVASVTLAVATPPDFRAGEVKLIGVPTSPDILTFLFDNCRVMPKPFAHCGRLLTQLVMPYNLEHAL